MQKAKLVYKHWLSSGSSPEIPRLHVQHIDVQIGDDLNGPGTQTALAPQQSGGPLKEAPGPRE